MKRILIKACWLGLASYCLLSSIAGPSGIVATMKTQVAADEMRQNLLNLETLNSAYAKEWEVLRNIPETTALEARSLGYLAENEVVIRLSIGAGSTVPPSPGSRISFEPQSIISEQSVKYLSCLFALISVILDVAYRLYSSPANKYRQREIRAHAASRL